MITRRGIPASTSHGRDRRRRSPAVLIVSDASDAHVSPVVEAIHRAGGVPVLLDLAEVPSEVSISVGHDPEGRWGARLERRGLSRILPPGLSSVWWRRPRAYGLHRGLVGNPRTFALRQVHEAVIGVWSAIGARWVNDPWRDQQGSHKLVHLSLAHDLGFDLPRTLVTTSPEEARTFLDRLGPNGCVRKSLSPTEAHCPPTRAFTREDAESLEALRLSPVILQERVPGVDLRVTVVGDEVFSCEIDARDTRSPNDFRPVFRECRVARAALPASVEKLARKMMTRLGLTYGAFDFRRGEDGRVVFLELNPAGQWLFVEQRTAQPIAAALARVLCQGDGAALAGTPLEEDRTRRVLLPEDGVRGRAGWAA